MSIELQLDVAEVIAKGERTRLRIGFNGGEGLYAPEPPSLALALEPGSFIAHANGEPCLDHSGRPVVFAKANTALAAVYSIATRASLAIGFSGEHAKQVDSVLASPGIDDSMLRDLRALPFVTIDYERSRDLDQAVYVERDGPTYVVYYALADAAYYVKPGTPLFDQALKRGTSFYMPGLTVPMLPRALSEGLVSLNERVDRRAFVFRIVVGSDGEVSDFELFRARIHSLAKLTYEGVQALIDYPKASALADTDIHRSMIALADVGELRIASANRRGVVDYDRTASSLSLPSHTSSALDVRLEERNGAQKWNEQISLVTNMVGAQFLKSITDTSTGIAGLFRTHPRPTKEEQASFAASVDELVSTLKLGPQWRWESDKETLAVYINRLPDDGPNGRLSRALQRQAMIMGRPSSFETEAAPHFGVGAEAYSRFSSPMREIVGIVTMHIALAQMHNTSLEARGLNTELIEAAARAGNRAGKLQKKLTRECNKLAIDQLLSSELELALDARPIRMATVMGVSREKIYLQLDDPPIEVKLYIPDQEALLGSKLELANRFEVTAADGRHRIRVGDLARVCVHEYAQGRERWVLRLCFDELGFDELGFDKRS